MTSKPLFGAGSAPRKPTPEAAPAIPPVAGHHPAANASNVPPVIPASPVAPVAAPGHVPPVAPAAAGAPAVPQQMPAQPVQIPQPAQTAAPQIAPAPPVQSAPPVQASLPDQFAPVAQPAPGAQNNLAVPPGVHAPSQSVPAASANAPTGSVKDRKHKRVRTLKGALIVLPGQMGSSFACKIRNQSRGGALALVANSTVIPDEIYLIWDADPGKKIPCKVAWRGPGRVGITFVDRLSCE